MELEPSGNPSSDSSGKNTDMINKFQDENGKHTFLSNFHVGLTVLGTPSAEHAYQMLKTTNVLDRMAVAACSTPGQAKRLGRKIELRPDWELVKIEVMRFVLLDKFAAGSPIAEQLLDTGDEILIEGNHWHDNIWGDCTCGRDACKNEGENLLGRLLMERRKQLRKI